MTKTLIIGDIHGKWRPYMQLLDLYEAEASIQVGDFGWGFPRQDPKLTQDLESRMSDGNHRYIRGNHDNPVCLETEFCIPDVTYDESTGVFYLGGAHSIDWKLRTPGVDWWVDEELGTSELYHAIDVYEQSRPRVVITHDGPESAVRNMFSWYHRDYGSRTRDALQSMFEIHQPALWIFGHWHTDHVYHESGTKFVCLGELSVIEVDL